MLYRFMVLLCLLLVNPVFATEPVKVDYMLNCQGCHLPDGSGFPARNVPKINDEFGRFLHVEGGRDYLIQVPGLAQSDLSSERLTRLINWMLVTFSANELPADFQPYSVDEVHQLRQTPLINVNEVRKGLIKKIQKLELES